MNNSDSKWEDLFQSLPVESSEQQDHRSRLKATAINAFDEAQPVPSSNLKHIGKAIMKYRIPQLTAVAILTALIVLTFQFSDTAVAFENVVSKIVNAKSARWETVVDLGDLGTQTTRTIIVPGLMRTEDQDGSITIMDLKSGKGVILDSDEKTAMRFDTGEGIPQSDSTSLDFFDQFQVVKDALAAGLESGEWKDAKPTGTKTVRGQELTGFMMSGEQKITIWVDSKTETAEQIEIQLASSGMTVLMKNYESDFRVDDSLFSMDIPVGYETMDVDLPEIEASEAEFIRTLRLSCEATDGTFPPGLDIESTSTVGAEISMRLMESMKLDSSGASNEQIEELTRATMGFTFVIDLVTRDNSDASYAGANVKLGQEGRPIFWYKPEDSDQYRVIFANLTVEEMDTAPDIDSAVKLSL